MYQVTPDIIPVIESQQIWSRYIDLFVLQILVYAGIISRPRNSKYSRRVGHQLQKKVDLPCKYPVSMSTFFYYQADSNDIIHAADGQVLQNPVLQGPSSLITGKSVRTAVELHYWDI